LRGKYSSPPVRECGTGWGKGWLLWRLEGRPDEGFFRTASRKPMRGRAKSPQKSWRVLSVALAFSYLESFRDYSP